MSKLLKKDKGFTLIEVVIVLAIAALIILVVLQAVNSAQKANRDAARKTEAGRMVSLLEQYASNNNGTYPPAASFAAAIQNYDLGLYNKYMGAAATTAGAGLGAASCGTAASNNYTVLYAPLTSGNRDYTLTECLEAGGAVVVTH